MKDKDFDYNILKQTCIIFVVEDCARDCNFCCETCEKRGNCFINARDCEVLKGKTKDTIITKQQEQKNEI